jgi:aromatic ring-cleaving dioxygenase
MCIPPVKFFFRLELEQTKQFSNSLLERINNFLGILGGMLYILVHPNSNDNIKSHARIVRAKP